MYDIYNILKENIYVNQILLYFVEYDLNRAKNPTVVVLQKKQKKEDLKQPKSSKVDDDPDLGVEDYYTIKLFKLYYSRGRKRIVRYVRVELTLRDQIKIIPSELRKKLVADFPQQFDLLQEDLDFLYDTAYGGIEGRPIFEQLKARLAVIGEDYPPRQILDGYDKLDPASIAGRMLSR